MQKIIIIIAIFVTLIFVVYANISMRFDVPETSNGLSESIDVNKAIIDDKRGERHVKTTQIDQPDEAVLGTVQNNDSSVIAGVEENMIVQHESNIINSDTNTVFEGVGSTQSINDQFIALEQELVGAQGSGLYLSSGHSERITGDLLDLENNDYNKDEIERLRTILTSLTVGSNNHSENFVLGTQSTCESNPSPIFTNDITDVSRLAKITPPGTIFDGGVVKSHSYLWIQDGKKVPVYAPVDMTLSSASHYITPQHSSVPQFLLFFEVSCEVEIKFDHILEPVEALLAVIPTNPAVDDSRTQAPSIPVSFKAGDIIAYTSGTDDAHNWDFGVYNTTISPNPVTNGVSNLEEIDKRADCGYDYFSIDKRSAYRNLFQVNIGGSMTSIPYCSI